MTWTGLVGAGMRAALAGRISLLSDARHWKENSAGVQLAQLRSLLRRAAGTAYGRGHDFARIAALEKGEMLAAYRAAVPVADWYAFKDMIARMREGAEPDVLWPGLVRDFAQTSGTTAGDKYIPVSKEMLRSNFRASLDIFAHLARFGVGLPWLTSGKSLFLGGSTRLDASDNGVRTGDLSGIVTPLIRWPISEIYLPGPEIALMSHWPSKIEAMARRCLDEDVRMVSGMCSWGLVLFEKVLELARARGAGAETIRDVWPNFRVFVHGGVKYAPFDPRIRRVYSGSPTGGDIPTRLELYPASEAFVAIQDTPGDGGMRLCADQMNFFEFVPLERINDSAPEAFACWEVEKAQRYVVVLSTCAGLWRYVLGDVVEFDSVPDRPLHLGGGGGDGPSRMRIVGRHRHFVNAFGENLIVEHIENAVARAAASTGVVVGEFTAAPVYPSDGTRAGLELAVEVESWGAAPRDVSLAAFSEAFDRALKDQNVDYTTKRSEGLGMAPPTISALARGTFHAWMEQRGKLGGQHKCPRCANGRELIDQVLACARERGSAA
ncbi:MAG TPA: GH3 auxin-responsive promoter family protein [Phycisphaerales bacterium]|nr:GH3 auxin-responsive promoter family protein [Phycisphaerales bacterium]